MIPVGICYRSLYLKKILIQLEGKVQLNELIPLPESRSIGRINTLFSLFHQEKKDINDAVQLWGIRNLTNSRQHSQYCSFQPVNPARFQLPGMPTDCRGSC
jgi:hypothetical protein